MMSFYEKQEYLTKTYFDYLFGCNKKIILVLYYLLQIKDEILF